MGIYTNAVMQTNRVGLPRCYISDLATDLGSCPKVPKSDGRGDCAECPHTADTPTCRKFNFTMLHKQSSTPHEDGPSGADWELSLWEDSSLIISYGNFFSGSRCGELARGAYGARESNMVWVPESIWHYNVQGRSATDGADQLRKKMNLAQRRIVRAGHKGIAFVLDIAMTNASIMWQWVQPNVKKKQKCTKVLQLPALHDSCDVSVIHSAL